MLDDFQVMGKVDVFIERLKIRSKEYHMAGQQEISLGPMLSGPGLESVLTFSVAFFYFFSGKRHIRDRTTRFLVFMRIVRHCVIKDR